MSDDDWDVPDEPKKSGTSTPAAAAPIARAPARGKFAGEDEDDVEEDDWDVSDSEKAKPAVTAAAPAPIRKKKLKDKLAEKERALAEGPADDLIDNRTEQDRARDAKREAREKEMAADMAAASDLFGDLSVTDPKATLEAILSARPKTKDEFTKLSTDIMALIISKHVENPLFPAFVEGFTKDICEPLTAVQVRKVGSGLSTLGNTKQQEERDKASGKKKGASKPKLGANKAIHTVDTDAYGDALDDDDFM